jgi:integrase
METLGTMAIIPNVGDARNLARQSMLRARSGINSIEARRTEQAEAKAEKEAKKLTFSKLADLFITKHAKIKQKEGTVYQTRRLLNRANEYWSDRPAQEIKKGDVLILLDEIAATRKRKLGHAGERPVREAQAVQVCLTTLFRWALAEDKIASNPMDGVRKDRFGKPKPRNRVLNADEIKAFWCAMDQMGWPYGPIGKLLLLTGQRENEVAGMRQSELKDALWHLPEARTKNARPHNVYLSSQALAVIDALPRIAGDLLFTTNKETAVSSFGRAKEQVDAIMGTAIAHWTWHDIRHCVITGMNEIGVEPHIVETIVNHISGFRAGVAGRYNHAVYANERIAAMQAWGDHIDSLIGQNVTTLRQTA